MSTAPEILLRQMFDAAVDAAMPARAIAEFLPEKPKGRMVIVGAGKASAEMARAFEAAWDGPLEGLVVTRYGHAVPCKHIEIVEARHPVPDENGGEAARRIMALAKELTEDDLMVALISGGGSALLSLPAEGLSLADKQAVNDGLLRSGANITQMNTVRKHLSAIKGGRLAVAAYPARCLTLSISDVPGDDPAVIASGPTVADETTLAQARALLGDDAPASAKTALENPANETPKPGDPRLSRAVNHIIARPQQSLEAAADVARAAGLNPIILGDALEGEARELGHDMARQALEAKTPCVLISGGETTVTLRGKGRGGRNVEFLLGLAQGLHGASHIHAIACDTDGVDGAEEVAGAIVTPDTLARAIEAGFPVERALEDNDGHSFFEALGDQVITGPTLTNVNDFRAILVGPKSP